MVVMNTKLFHRWRVFKFYTQRKLLHKFSKAVPKECVSNSCFYQNSIIKGDEQCIPGQKNICIPLTKLHWTEGEKCIKLLNPLKISTVVIQSVLKANFSKDVKHTSNLIKCKCVCLPRNFLTRFRQSVILGELSSRVYFVSACHYSTQTGSGDGEPNQEGTNSQEHSDVEAWEMLVDYNKLSPTEKKIHERHRTAVKKKQLMYVDPLTGYHVMTRTAHLERGECCGNACRHK
ncbi:uncharacterized protein LOC132757636 isoform X2 [Ruditapes philippinarum]|uniref:uncharacterized protein LOC132757636 isoform X2 n=1 Tax=Ruditapes philippinarum TaxID=129788 RepID=UPI00295B0AF9|nr:uncharacterized protein LOC132757636 isoform X2 [Ruditapes philippinarum]